MAKKYLFTAEVLFTVPDDFEACADELANEGGSVQETACFGDCGGEDDRYFWDRLKDWLNGNRGEGAQNYSTEIERYYDEDE